MAVLTELEERIGARPEELVPCRAMRIVAACAAQRFFFAVNADLSFALQRMSFCSNARGMRFSCDPGMTGETAGVYG